LWKDGGGGGWTAGLETDFDYIEGIADYDADGAAYVAGPEIGGHL